jgi:hypothetical protein
VSLIKAQPAADAIAVFLAEGITHPGNPDTKQPAASLKIPMFSAKGKPPPFGDAIRASNQTIAEAIIYYIESQLGCTIIANTELGALRQEEQDAYDRGYADACNQAPVIKPDSWNGEDPWPGDAVLEAWR